MSKNLVAIDTGLNLTKVLGAESNKGVLEIITLESFKTPFKENEIDPKAFFEQLYKFIPLSKIRESDLAISVPSSSISFTTLEAPKMPKEDLDKAVLRDLKRKILPQPLEEDIFRYNVLREAKVKEATQLNILAAAGSKETIFKYLSLFKQQGITPNLIGSTPLALVMYFREYKPVPAENYAFIDIGFKNTSVVIFNKTDIALIRNIPFACLNFFEAIAKETGSTIEDAQDLFLRQEVKEALILDSWQYLLSELQRSFAYYKEITVGQKIDSVIFSGGMFKAGGSLDFLRENMEGNLEVLNLVASKHILVKKLTESDVLSQGALFATALGLALNLKSAKGPILNFLPAEVPREKKLKKIELISKHALFISAVVLIVLCIISSARMVFIKGKIAKMLKGFSESDYQNFSQKAAQISSVLSKLQQQKDLAAKISQYQLPWEKLFAILSATLPKKAFIKEISVAPAKSESQTGAAFGGGFGGGSGSGGGDDESMGATQGMGSPGMVSQEKLIAVKIRGAIFGDYEQASQELDNFYKGLMDSGLFSGISLEPLKLEDIIIQGRAVEESLTQVREREFSLEAKVKSK